MTEAVIFDLDGTLLDTLQDLCNSTNYALRQSGFPERSLDEVRRFVGNGVANLMRRAVPEGTTAERTEACLEKFKEHYEVHKCDLTQPYPGILELLETLEKSGYQTAVVSNKFDPAVKGLCEQYFPGRISVAVGEREAEGVRKKPAPDMVEEALCQLGVRGEAAVYVGDSEVDVETAKNAGLRCVSVSWGFRTGEELREAGAAQIVDRPQELANLL